MGIERFLIVDEVEANILFFNVVLGELGFKYVFSSPTGAAALDDFVKHKAQLVITAWELNAMPGTVLLQRLKTDRRRSLPYLLYSKRMTEQDLVLTREMGIANILTMPLDKEKAKAEIKALIQREEQVPKEEIALRKIEGFLADNKPNDALQMIDAKLLKKGPFSSRAHCAMGQVWMMSGQLPKAEASFTAALADDPDNYDAASHMATLYSRTGRHDAAIAQLQKMNAKSPKNIATMLNLGSAYVEADKPAEAKKTFDMVGTIDPDSPALKDERAKLAFKEGDMSLAAQLLAETQNGDALARHFNNVAISLTHQKQYDKAIETYSNAIKLLINKGKLHALRYNLGLALAKKGELARSFSELAASYKDEPTFEKAYAAIARVTKEMGEKGIAPSKELIREVKEVRAKAVAGKDAKPAAKAS